MNRLLLYASAIIMTMLVACETDVNDNSGITLTSPAEMTVSMYGGRSTITYKTTGDVSPEDIDVTNTADWLRIVNSKALGEVVFETEANETGGTRMAAITIIFANQRTTVVVKQLGSPEDPILTLTSEPEVAIDRASQPVVITYNLENKNDADIIYAKVDVDWIYSIDTFTEGEIKLYVATNISNEERTANITVGYGSASCEVTLTQAGEGDINFSAAILSGEYLGDAATPGIGNYWIILSDRGFDSEGKSLPGGTYYRIDAYADAYNGSDAMVPIPEGEYTFDDINSYMTMTFAAEYSSFFVNDKDGKHDEKISFEEGTMIVKSGEITLELTIDGVKHTVTYKGDTKLTDAQGEANILTTLTSDYKLNLSDHTMVYECYGDYYDYGYTNWMFVIKPNGANGDWVQLDIITSYSDEADGFTGEYKASEVLAVNSFIPGWMNTGVMECSWVFTTDRTVLARLRDGKVVVTQDENGTYTVDIDVYDDLRNNITGRYVGTATNNKK